MKKKGISEIIITIIIIGIALVVVGIIWYVISELITGQTEGIVYSEKCLKVNLNVVSASCTGLDCDVLIKRNVGGDSIEGVRGIFYRTDGTSEVLSPAVDGNIAELVTVNKDFTITQAANKVEIYPYFIKDDSSEHLCSNAITADIN